MNRHRALPFVVFIAALLLAGFAWVAGFATNVALHPPPAAAPVDVQAPENFGLFNEAWGVVDREFYGQRPAAVDVADGAVAGLVAALGDEHAAYLSPEEAAKAGDLSHPMLIDGLGLWVEQVTDGAVVLAVVPGPPAELAKLLPGDRILAAGDTPLAGLGVTALREALSGEVGTTAQLVVQHGEGQPASLEVKRATVDVPDVGLTRPRPGVAVLRLSHLDPKVITELDAALAGLQADPTEALVLDLRNNPGGDPASVQAAAGRFFQGNAWVELDRSGHETARAADTAGAPAFPRPERLVVLVNAGTAGGAEMLAGALRDQASARLIGQPTFGKGTVQSMVELADKSVMRMTVATWRTPSGADVDGDGLLPDEAVDGAEPQLDAALRAAAASATAGG